MTRPRLIGPEMVNLLRWEIVTEQRESSILKPCKFVAKEMQLWPESVTLGLKILNSRPVEPM